MLAAKVEDMINTVVRQIAFYSFERKLHTERRNGELTAEQIGELWMSVQGESLGPAIELGPGYETFWAYIPHFIHSPFYVYAYAFGDCLVNSLYAVYEKAARAFAERYFACSRPAAPSTIRNCSRPSASTRATPPSGRSGWWRLRCGAILREGGAHTRREQQ
jgi:oligoendopeptidase F